jgi:hypothetical protein
VSADFVGIWFTSFGVIKSFGREFAIGAGAKPDAVIYGCIRSSGPQRRSRRLRSPVPLLAGGLSLVMEWPSMFRDVQALMIDLDGVLYVDEDPIAGAIEAVERLLRRGLRVRFVTNTTARNGDLSIVSSAAHPAARHVCRTGPGRPRPDGHVLLLATSAHAGPSQTDRSHRCSGC